ncbi:conserved hypothetical protein [Vibrio crassostreae]|nr:hypothetical protein FCV85_01030 [Vibrio sp. F13]CAK1931739.1 conserved hypothetical protein [Vibrio crassostreae]CAK2727372.1 conserved hypothetical protein [Vibrio crassostreae]
MNHHVFAVVQGQVIQAVFNLVLESKEEWREAVNCHPTRCAIKIDTRGDSESSKGTALASFRILSERVDNTDSVKAINTQDNLSCFAFSLRGRR